MIVQPITHMYSPKVSAYEQQFPNDDSLPTSPRHVRQDVAQHNETADLSIFNSSIVDTSSFGLYDSVLDTLDTSGSFLETKQLIDIPDQSLNCLDSSIPSVPIYSTHSSSSNCSSVESSNLPSNSSLPDLSSTSPLNTPDSSSFKFPSCYFTTESYPLQTFIPSQQPPPPPPPQTSTSATVAVVSTSTTSQTPAQVVPTQPPGSSFNCSVSVSDQTMNRVIRAGELRQCSPTNPSLPTVTETGISSRSDLRTCDTPAFNLPIYIPDQNLLIPSLTYSSSRTANSTTGGGISNPTLLPNLVPSPESTTDVTLSKSAGSDNTTKQKERQLLSSEDVKKLSSKERRQLRNKVSARAFRSRRKEYISQLENEVSKRNLEVTDLRHQNSELRTEVEQTRKFVDGLIRNTTFMTILPNLLDDPALCDYLEHCTSVSQKCTLLKCGETQLTGSCKFS